MKKLITVLMMLLFIIGCSMFEEDCAGERGGDAVIDSCGRCTGGTTRVTTTCKNLDWFQIGYIVISDHNKSAGFPVVAEDSARNCKVFRTK